MGRHRTIDRAKVLDAAEQVVVRDGAANLTLDAVAVAAGISKASVLYDYKTKKALIRALIERRVAVEEELLSASIAAQPAHPDATILGYISASTRAFSEEERAVGLNLCAALAQDAEVREPVSNSIQSVISRIRSTSTNPDAAMLAFLATEGLIMLDWFGFHQFTPDERARFIAAIERLACEPAASSEAAPSSDSAPISES